MVLTNGGDNYNCDHGDWAGARLTPVTSTTTAPTASGTYLSDLTWASMTNGFGPVEKDRSNGDTGASDGRTITLNGVTYAKGLGAHASSELVYNLGGQYTSFTTDMGIDDETNTTGCGSVEFQIYLDNVLVYSSGVMNVTTATKSTTLNVTGKQTLKLVLTNGGDNNNCDHGDWAGARLLGTGSGRVATEADNPELRMQVYPVPAREEIWVRYYAEAAGDVNLQLLNMVALPVMQSIHPVSQGENLIRMNVRELARGAYIMSLVQDKKRLTKKILLTE